MVFCYVFVQLLTVFLYHFVRFNLTRVLGKSTRQTLVGYITTIQKQKNQPGQYQRNWQNLRVSWTNIHDVQEVKDWIPVGDSDFFSVLRLCYVDQLLFTVYLLEVL